MAKEGRVRVRQFHSILVPVDLRRASPFPGSTSCSIGITADRPSFQVTFAGIPYANEPRYALGEQEQGPKKVIGWATGTRYFPRLFLESGTHMRLTCATRNTQGDAVHFNPARTARACIAVLVRVLLGGQPQREPLPFSTSTISATTLCSIVPHWSQYMGE